MRLRLFGLYLNAIGVWPGTGFESIQIQGPVMLSLLGTKFVMDDDPGSVTSGLMCDVLCTIFGTSKIYWKLYNQAISHSHFKYYTSACKSHLMWCLNVYIYNWAGALCNLDPLRTCFSLPSTFLCV